MRTFLRSHRLGKVSVSPFAAATLGLIVSLGVAGCSSKTCTGFEAPARQSDRVQLVADFGQNQATGVAVSRNGRVFVNFPDWRLRSGLESAMSVAEVMPDGSLRPYPDLKWNGLAESAGLMSSAMGKGWDAQDGGGAELAVGVSVDGVPLDPTTAGGPTPGESAMGSVTGDSMAMDEEEFGRPDPGVLPDDRFVCVQSVYIDSRDRLWILDSSAPSFGGVQYVGGGPKLIEVDLKTDSIARVIRFDTAVLPFNGYLNDVRVDTSEEVAFITDSGLGALIVVDLVSHKARRVLSEDPSTKADSTLQPMIGGMPWRSADSGAVPQIHSDGLALDEKNKILYWQSLTGDTLHAIDSRILSSRTVPEWQIANSVRTLGTTCVADGMWCDALGDLYFTSLELDAVTRLNGALARRALREGTRHDWRSNLRFVGQDPRLGWPDSLAIGPAGPTGPGGERQPGGQYIYVTTSQIHRSPAFAGDAGAAPIDPVSGSMGWALYRISLP